MVHQMRTCSRACAGILGSGFKHIFVAGLGLDEVSESWHFCARAWPGKSQWPEMKKAQGASSTFWIKAQVQVHRMLMCVGGHHTHG